MTCHCCAPPGGSGPSALDVFFTRRSARYLRRFRKRGLAREQKLLLRGIGEIPPGGWSVLEIGCGIGALVLHLLRAGATTATLIDAAAGMIRNAGLLLSDSGYAGRADLITGDFLEVGAGVAPADIVVLDKVVCCYGDIDRLLDLSLSKTRQLCALTWPRDLFSLRAAAAMLQLLARLLGWKFHPFWHDWKSMRGSILAAGFSPVYEGNAGVWSVGVFRRTHPPTLPVT